MSIRNSFLSDAENHNITAFTQTRCKKEGLEKFNNIRKILEFHVYDDLQSFWRENNISCEKEYLDIIRARITRPMVFLQRELQQIRLNSFNPWLAENLKFNMDFQIIQQKYSCASNVIEYINKTDRGISNLHRELIRLKEQFPEENYSELLRRVSISILNNVEMSIQEAAWYVAFRDVKQ